MSTRHTAPRRRPFRLGLGRYLRYPNRWAYEREQDIDFVKLWVDIPLTLDRTDVEVDRLLTPG